MRKNSLKERIVLSSDQMLDLIHEHIDANYKSSSDFARNIGCTSQHLSNILNKRSPITPEIAHKIAGFQREKLPADYIFTKEV